MKKHYKATLKASLLIAAISFFTTKTEAQHFSFGNGKTYCEAGLNFGPTFFLGDLGGNAGYGSYWLKDVNLELTKMMKGAFITVYPNSWMGVRLAAQVTYVAGEDYIINTDGVNELWRKQRNLDFKSTIYEGYTAVELFPISMFHNNDEEYSPTFKPYGFVGIGVFNFNPKGSLTDANGNKTWYKLHPLSTEGQGFPEYPNKKPYKLTQMNIPMGFGLKVRVSERVNISPELLYRKTFTDYIDDVSTTYIDPIYFDMHLSPENAAIARQISDKTFGIVTPGVNRYEPGTMRGNSKNNDAYFSVILKLGIRLGSMDENGFSDGRDRRSDRKARRQTKCPHFY